MIKKREPADHTVIYVDVLSVEEYAKKVDENGGKILVQKTEVKDMGYFIYCEDSEQNRFVLWEGYNLAITFYPILLSINLHNI